MHAGPLGVLLDVTASALVEICREGKFGFCELTRWDDRLQAQLSAAYVEFCEHCSNTCQHHTIRRFTRCGFSMYNTGSWPAYKGKAHNTLVMTRWLGCKCSEFKDGSDYSRTRYFVLFAWTQWFDVCLGADPDFLEHGELVRLSKATKLMIRCHRKLANLNVATCTASWEIKPKLHVMFHILKDAESGRRNPKAWWSFKEEEMMGRLATIACATHACTLARRTLERWCLQFFSAMSDDSEPIRL